MQSAFYFIKLTLTLTILVKVVCNVAISPMNLYVVVQMEILEYLF